MRTLTLVALLAITATLAGCNLKEVIGPDGDIKITNISGTNSGSTTATGTSNSTSYLPVSKNSTWSYQLFEFGGVLDKYTFTMTGNTTTVNNLTYYEFTRTSTVLPTVTNFYAYDNHLYIVREDHNLAGSTVTLDMPYLKDDIAVGGTWTSATFPSGLTGYDAQFVGKLVEKDFTKVVNNKSFPNVYHSHVELIYSYNGGVTATQVKEAHDYYVAKGIGIIEIDDTIAGQDAGKTTILNYNIK